MISGNDRYDYYDEDDVLDKLPPNFRDTEGGFQKISKKKQKPFKKIEKDDRGRNEREFFGQ